MQRCVTFVSAHSASRSVIDKTTVSNGLLGKKINCEEKLIIELMCNADLRLCRQPKKLIIQQHTVDISFSPDFLYFYLLSYLLSYNTIAITVV